MDELLREIAPAYETPFDRSRPRWEARIFNRLRPPCDLAGPRDEGRVGRHVAHATPS
jgi:hypothetical protein